MRSSYLSQNYTRILLNENLTALNKLANLLMKGEEQGVLGIIPEIFQIKANLIEEVTNLID